MILYLGQQKANILHWNLRKEKTLYAAVRERIRETTCSRHSPAHFFPLYILYFNWQPAILVASLNTQTWTQIKRLVEFIAWSSLLRMPSIKIILIFCHIQKRMVHPVYRFVREREMFASQRIAGVCLCMYIYIYICEVIAKLNKKTRVLYDGDDDECIDIYLMLMSLHHHFDNECCFLCLQKLQKKRKKKWSFTMKP